MDSTDLSNAGFLEKTEIKIYSTKREESSITNDGISGLIAKRISQKAEIDLSSNALSFIPSCRSLKDIDRSGAVSTRDFISVIPYKLATYLLGYMDAFTIVQMGQTSRHWKVISGDHDLWKLLFTNRGWQYDDQAIDNYLIHGKLSNRPLLQQRGAEFDGDIRFYHYQALFDRRFINWRRLYRNRTLIEKRWRDGIYRPHIFSTASPHAATSLSSDNGNHGDGNPGSKEPLNDWIYCLQFNNNILASGGRNRTLKIWSMDTATCLHTLSGHNGGVLCLQFDDDCLISGSSDTSMIVWDMSTGTKVRTLEGHSESVLDLQFIGRRLISASKDRTLRIWDLDTGLTTQILNGHRAAVNAIRFKGDIVVSASGDRTIRLWNTCTGAMIRTFEYHGRGVACVDFDGEHIISGSSDQTIKVFDSVTGDCLRTLSGHTELVRALQWDTLSDRIISGSYDGTLRIWNMKKGTLLQILDDKVEKRILDVKFDYSKIICCANMSSIFIYDFAYDLDTHFLA